MIRLDHIIEFFIAIFLFYSSGLALLASAVLLLGACGAGRLASICTLALIFGHFNE